MAFKKCQCCFLTRQINNSGLRPVSRTAQELVMKVECENDSFLYASPSTLNIVVRFQHFTGGVVLPLGRSARG